MNLAELMYEMDEFAEDIRFTNPRIAAKIEDWTAVIHDKICEALEESADEEASLEDDATWTEEFDDDADDGGF